MKKLIKVMFCMISLFMVVSLAGCSSDSSGELQGSKFDSNISLVKNGYPTLIPNITYSQAYEYFFGNPQWRGFESEEGKEVVEFSGECAYYDEDATVYIQFVLEGDKFTLHYASIEVDDEKITADASLINELIYKPFALYSEDILGESLSQEVKDAFYVPNTSTGY